MGFNAPGAAFQPFVIGIAGGTASGKTTVCDRIIQSLSDQRVVLISLDEFYRDLTEEECANVTDVNFDDPSLFDVPALLSCLDALRRAEAVDVPVYDFVTNRRSDVQSRRVMPADVVVIEGILVLHVPEILERLNMKIFVETDDDVRLVRRIRRDTTERGRDVESVLLQYTRFVKPCFDRYVAPSKLKADVIIPWREDNHVAVNLISEHIRAKLSLNDLRRIYSNLHVMPSTMQTRGIHTKIRCHLTSRVDFVFYADRLIRLVVECALALLPFQDCIVSTPCGEPYSGLNFCDNLCGVSVIRSGEAMENALRACCSGIKIGKMLIKKEKQAELVYEKLPHDIANRHVLLMDPILATGTKLLRVIQALINHWNVPEEKIILLTLIAAPEGIHKVCSRHPGLKLVTTEIDQTVGKNSEVRPGTGNFGDRYFGTGNDVDQGIICLEKHSPRHSSSASEDASPDGNP
mmetsp:Transcript_24191/g.53662  ORF Transcript_24191/g.53662 Transcript_24191/m.53662 type:complete len:463 (+) Transcript_24191:83-1471(+)